MLEDLGHTVFSATSGAEALRLLKEKSDIDLLITDQAMPGMTGSELAAAVRSQWPDLPIIIATGYAELPEMAVEQRIRSMAQAHDLLTMRAWSGGI